MPHPLTSTAQISIRVHDVDRAARSEFEDEPHLIARMPDHELWMTFFRDSDRNLTA